MYSILDIIMVLEEKRAKLNLNREINLVKIQECERLIQYYCTLYSRTLGSINRKKESLVLYDEILDIKEKIRSPRWMEAIVPLSYKYIDKKRSFLISKISSLTEQSDDIKENVELYQKKKFSLIRKTMEIERELGHIDEEIRHSNCAIKDNNHVKKLILKG